MIEKLKSIANKSYSPYSNFKVAAILESSSGELYGGANIENSSFPLSMCAECVAIGVAKMKDADFSKIINVHIFSPDADFNLVPCGACRQVLVEHLNLNTTITMYSNNGKNQIMKLKDILPSAFIAKDFLGKK
ncbi:MAG: cytidine deaminase [Metamycoplasmataceae bacterium]